MAMKTAARQNNMPAKANPGLDILSFRERAYSLSLRSMYRELVKLHLQGVVSPIKTV